MTKEYVNRIKIVQLVLVLLTSLLSRLFLLYLTWSAHQGDLSVLIRTDETRYIKEAANILQNGFTLIWDAPLYPLCLAGLFKLTGVNYLFASILNIIFFSLAIGVFYITIARFLKRTEAFIATLILILFPTLFMNILRPTAEALYLLLFAIMTYAFLIYLIENKVLYGVIASAMLGMLTLTKETFLFLPIIAIAITFIRYLPKVLIPIRKSLLITIIYILALFPVLFYNYQTKGDFVLSRKMSGIINNFPCEFSSTSAENHAFLKKSGAAASLKKFFWERKRFFLGTGTFSMMHGLGYETKKLRAVANDSRYFAVLKEYGRGWLVFQYIALFFVILVLTSAGLSLLVLIIRRRWRESGCIILTASYFMAAYYCRYNSRYFIILLPLTAYLSSYFWCLVYRYVRQELKNKSICK